MEIFRRPILAELLMELQHEKLLLLVGARQVGKTTLLHLIQETYQKHTYINCDDFFDRTFRDKKAFLDFLLVEKGFDFRDSQALLLLDEIQIFPDPEQLLKSLYDDQDFRAKIVATGSRFW